MKVQHFQMECKGVERLPDGKGVKIRGFASTPDIDRSRDIVLPSAFAKSLAEYQKSGGKPALLRSHNPDRVVGYLLMQGEDAPTISEKGLAIAAIVNEPETAADVESGNMQTFSIGYICTQKKYDIRPTGRYEKATGQELYVEVRILEELDWVETSIVSTPDNKNALFSVEKSATKMFDSLPSSSMERKCSVYPDQNAAYKIGDRWLSQKAVDEMQFKGQKPMTVAEIEAKSFDTKDAADDFIEEKELKDVTIEEKDGKFALKFAAPAAPAKEEKAVMCVIVEGGTEEEAKGYVAELKLDASLMKKTAKGFSFPQFAADQAVLESIETVDVKTGVRHIVATKVEKKDDEAAAAAAGGDQTQPQAPAGDAATAPANGAAKSEAEKAAEKGEQASDEGKQAATVEQKSAMKLMLESMRDSKAIEVTDEEIKSMDTVVDTHALNGALYIMTKMASAMVAQHKQMDLVKQALALIPLQKGKTIHAILQNGASIANGALTDDEKKAVTDTEQKDAAMRNWLLQAKNGKEFTIGDDE